MKSAGGFAGVAPEQGPPLLVPTQFFLLAPVAIVLAGGLLFDHEQGLTFRMWPNLMAAAHLGTLGFLTAVMFGAMFQMIPVVAGAPVPFIRLSHVVHASLVGGVGALVAAFLGWRGLGFPVAGTVLAIAVALFVLPALWALARSPVRTATIWGMRVAVLGLAALVVAGFLMARARAGYQLPVDYRLVLYCHLGLGGLVWLGGLICAVSWQVVPMFYLSAPFSPALTRGVLLATAGSLIGCCAAVGSGAATEWIYVAIAPAAIAVWLVHPLAVVRQLHHRRRRRSDPSLRFWYAGLLCAPVALLLLVAVHYSYDTRLPLALGWTVIWGWAGLIVHGMLGRIVPFLVWFHRYSHRVGHEWVPTMRQLLPPRIANLGLALHGTTLTIGWIAVATGSPGLCRATGVGLAATGLVLGYELLTVLGRAFEAGPK